MRYLSFAVVLFALLAAGCELDPFAAGPLVTTPAQTPDSHAQPPAPDDPAAAAVAAYAERLTAADRAAPPPPAASAPVANEVMWLNPRATDDRATNPAAPGRDRLPVSANTIIETHPAQPMAQPQPAPPRDVTAALYDRIDAEGESDFAKALRVVAINLADPDAPLDPRYLDALPPDQQDAVRLYHQIMRTMQQQLLGNRGRFDRDALAARMDEIFGQQPIAIRDIRLCRRVMGYGVYDPFESTTFLAGRENRMIVYVELEDFAALDRGDGQFSVDLQQEVTLYSADGLAVWRNEPVEVNDTSANRRRDFFVVQLVKLPPRLSVGKYRLKVRVTDLNGGSIDEQGLDLDIVADQSMVERPPTESLPLR